MNDTPTEAPDPANPLKDPGTIDRLMPAFDFLHARLESLHHFIADLENTLSPVLGPQEPPPGAIASSETTEQPGAYVVQEVLRLSAEVRRAELGLVALLDRVRL